MSDEPKTPGDELSEEDKLNYINKVMKKAEGVLKKYFSPEVLIQDVFKLTCMESDFSVAAGEKSVTSDSFHFGKQEVEWAQLKKASIVTTDKGPFTADVFMVLVSDTAGCVIPQGSPGYQKVYDKVTALEGVNFENIIKAMSSSSNQEFVIWEKR